MARKHTYSQHFLRSPRLVAELVGHSNIRKNDTVYDLGAGSGLIASVLARRAKQVFAIEIEPHVLQTLHRNLQIFKNVTIVEQSILTLAPTTPYKIFANIPFSLSADVVRHFAFSVAPPKSMYLIVQKQFARKLVPGNDHFTSQLSAELAPFFSVRIRRPLRKTDFTPPPAVDTVLLEIKPHEVPLLDIAKAESWREFIAKSFHSQPYFAALPRAKAAISPEHRPSQLSPAQWLKLYALAH